MAKIIYNECNIGLNMEETLPEVFQELISMGFTSEQIESDRTNKTIISVVEKFRKNNPLMIRWHELNEVCIKLNQSDITQTHLSMYNNLVKACCKNKQNTELTVVVAFNSYWKTQTWESFASIIRMDGIEAEVKAAFDAYVDFYNQNLSHFQTEEAANVAREEYKTKYHIVSHWEEGKVVYFYVDDGFEIYSFDGKFLKADITTGDDFEDYDSEQLCFIPYVNPDIVTRLEKLEDKSLLQEYLGFIDSITKDDEHVLSMVNDFAKKHPDF